MTMMIKHYKLKNIDIKTDEYWKPCWYGLARLKECYSDEAWGKFKQTEKNYHVFGYLGEKELEVDLLLALLQEIKNKDMTFLELGAGYADWCLAANGVVRNNIVPTQVKNIECYAIEAEPMHFKWAVEHFKHWDIKGQVINGVVSDISGYCAFAVSKDPSSDYGQSITLSDGKLRTLSNILKKKSVNLPCYTVEELLHKYNLKHIDMIDMDVQGNEVRVVKGALPVLDKIDYWKIGTHHKKYNEELKKILLPYYDLLVDIKPYSVGEIDGLKVKVEDGIQVYKRKCTN